jgi:L-asparaginase II
MSQVLCKVFRGNILESIHRGHFAVVDGEGQIVDSGGDSHTVTFFRSACKPHQALPLLTSGAAEAFGFTEDEIAMTCASHSGEPFHVAVVARMLAKLGLTASDLNCGVHAPFNDKESKRLATAGEEPTPLHNNCSGKHTGMLALAKHIGAETANYEHPDHRVQQRIQRVVAEFTKVPSDSIGIGIDGCAVPNFAVPVEAMARSFAGLVFPGSLHPETKTACRRIVQAMIKYPELIGGTDRLDTILMRAGDGRFISKVGAEGVWCCGVVPCDEWPTGLGITLKIEDGDDLWSRSVTAIHLLRRLGALQSDQLPDLSPMAIKNRRGDVVGAIEASF